mgnify:CR=1 FL=1
MACEDCENKIPDRTVDKNCSDGINDVILGKISDAAVGPVSFGPTDVTRRSNPDIAIASIKHVSNAVRNISKRFGKVQPGIYITDREAQQASGLNTEMGIIFDDLENNLEIIVNNIAERTAVINEQVKNKSDDCENIFDGFQLETPFGMDWVNPIAFSTKLKVGTCRLDLGCQFCDFPGDLTLPPFPGIPSCNFIEDFDDICGVEFLNPFTTAQNIINGFQLFATQVGQFAYAATDLVGLATGFLGTCIMRILNCLSKFFADLNFDLAMPVIGSKIRETILATSAAVVSVFARINTVFITIMEIIKAAISELFRFIDDILSLCDPCKLTEAILNPATLPEIPSFGF